MIDYIFALLDWCKTQILLRNQREPVLFKEGEIWWCSIGVNVGVEIFGKDHNFSRPVLIFKRFNADGFLAIPLTTRQKEGSWYVPIRYGGREGRAILNQVRSLDRSRLRSKIGMLTDANIDLIKAAFLNFYCQ